MRVESEQRPEKLSESDFDSLKVIYAELGRLYEQAPHLRSVASKKLARKIERERAVELKGVDIEEKREEEMGGRRVSTLSELRRQSEMQQLMLDVAPRDQNT